jgi:hypothetical protein
MMLLDAREQVHDLVGDQPRSASRTSIGLDRTAVGHGLVDPVDRRHQRVRDTCLQWVESAEPGQRLDRAEAEEAVIADVEPQMVVQAALTCEWEHHGNPRWLQQTKQDRPRAPVKRS